MDGVIDNSTVETIWIGAALVTVLLVVLRYRLLAPPMGPPLKFGGPWTLLNPQFWKERDPSMPPQALRWIRIWAIALGGMYVVLDSVF